MRNVEIVYSRCSRSCNNYSEWSPLQNPCATPPLNLSRSAAVWHPHHQSSDWTHVCCDTTQLIVALFSDFNVFRRCWAGRYVCNLLTLTCKSMPEKNFEREKYNCDAREPSQDSGCGRIHDLVMLMLKPLSPWVKSVSHTLYLVCKTPEVSQWVQNTSSR